MTIEEPRLEKGMTREAFAERLGIDPSALEDCESRKRNPSAKELDAIMDIFGVKLSTQARAEAAGPEVAQTVEGSVTGEAFEEGTEEAIEEAIAEVIEDASAEETALIAAAEKEARKAAEDAAAREAAASIPIEDCQITVKDVTFTGKKIKKPSVRVVCGETNLEPGEDYSLKYDKKARDIGLYMLTVKGRGRFTGSVKAPFYMVLRPPSTSARFVTTSRPPGRGSC